jgi:hypothetical protein
MITYNPTFPQQRVSASTKSKADWYANCIDYIIDAGLSFNDRSEAEEALNILHGNIPNEYYKKTLNPYNSNKERYTRFPATMRNYDIMSDVIRRYVSEYYKGVHDFVATANNPEITLKRNAKLQEKVMQLCQQEFQRTIEQNLQQMQQQAAQNGTPMEQINPQEAIPDVEQFVKDFNEKYVDDESKQAQDILDFVKSITNDNTIYLSAFFNFCTLGECYTYTDVRGDEIYKECVPVIEAYPIPNEKPFVEDHDMFARKMLMSYSQIIDMFDDVLTKKDKEFLDKFYNTQSPLSTRTQFLYSQYFEYFPDVCEKFQKEERDLFRKESVHIAADNNNLFEVWHVVWKGEAKQGILTYINEVGFPTQRIVEEGYQLNPDAGDIDIEWVYEPQVYEGYRIGTRYTAIYPIKARAIPYNRNGKLPYNGIMEVLPMMGKFSIIKIITPFQIMRNIIAYHREMVIAKNKMLVLLIPESLIASDEEDKIYRMAADGTLYVDDSEDTNSQKMAQIRMLNANLGDYITQLTNLIEAIKVEARELVDMNAQRYGNITQYAGHGTTQEAIAQSSMGTIVIITVFDEMRSRDYQRDIDYCKFAYIEGLQTSFFDDLHRRRYISLDVNSFVNSDISIYAKNDQKELDKINQLRQWAFSAAQNGDLDMALAAITGNNVPQIKDTINKFMEVKRQHEQQMQQAEQMLKQEELQNKLTEIQAKGEEERKTLAMKYEYELQLNSLNAQKDMAISSMGDDGSEDRRLKEIAENNSNSIARDKLNLDRQKMQVDLYNKAADRQIKREDMATKLKIAQTNKNKYDK